MTFSDVVSAFNDSLPGTDSYVKLRESMQILIAEDSSNAAIYFLIFGFARTYVMLYEDQAISPEFAESNKQLMLSYLNKLESAVLSHSEAEKFERLNQVVNEYNQSKKVF